MPNGSWPSRTVTLNTGIFVMTHERSICVATRAKHESRAGQGRPTEGTER
jgi:hypothetical protein